LCINGNDYGLIWADDHWAVSDPEMTIVGKPDEIKQFGNDVTVAVYSGTKGSETTTSVNVEAYVRKGMVFNGQWVKCQYFDDSQKWEVLDPALAFIGKADFDEDAPNGSLIVSLWTGNLSAETDSGVNVSNVMLRFGDVTEDQFVRCSWQDSGTVSGWEVTNVVCG
jgi:hypothetical protein